MNKRYVANLSLLDKKILQRERYRQTDRQIDR